MRYWIGSRSRSLIAMAVACGLMALSPSAAWATFDISPQGVVVAESEDGTVFSIGLLERIAFFHLDELDFNEDFNFRAVTVGDLVQGDTRFGARNFTDIMLQLEKGPVKVFTMIEVDAIMDELVADINSVNLEQAVASYTPPNNWGTIHAGFGVHFVDIESGNLIYGDEAPGVWWLGAKGPWSWNVGYVKRIDGNRGVPFGRSGTDFPGSRGAFEDTDVDTDIFWVRAGYDFQLGGGNHIALHPLVVVNLRNTPQSATSVFPCPLGGGPALAAGNCDQGPLNPLVSDTTSEATYFYPSMVVTGQFGPVTLTAQAAGRLGELDELPADTYAISGANPSGITDFDADSFGVFGELAFDLTNIAPNLAGLTPFVSVHWNRGDDDPFDDNLGGWVPISDLNEGVRKDSFNLRSITSYGPMTLGGACEAAFGFNTVGRGTGPTLGSALDDASLASPVFFNNRCGKGDNPGLIRANFGWIGNITPKWETHLTISPMWFADTASIEAEAAGSRIARGVDTLGCAGDPDCVRKTADSLDVDPYMGTQVNFNIGYRPVPNFRVQPFFSVFFPGQAADDIGSLFLDDGDTDTAWISGIEFMANF